MSTENKPKSKAQLIREYVARPKHESLGHTDLAELITRENEGYKVTSQDVYGVRARIKKEVADATTAEGLPVFPEPLFNNEDNSTARLSDTIEDIQRLLRSHGKEELLRIIELLTVADATKGG
jgi:hypothetical protein